ncbi:hypothetical protein [Streptacidiphilus melanogenes]|uniref:hypothetical protein n=1 Tax=Streptacidiphilus melanogenes TaxID=411235 RepID=UPI0005AAB4E8|nr:hypothetical protein [Streptacidiphilus melanogenes]
MSATRTKIAALALTATALLGGAVITAAPAGAASGSASAQFIPDGCGSDVQGLRVWEANGYAGECAEVFGTWHDTTGLTWPNDGHALWGSAGSAENDKPGYLASLYTKPWGQGSVVSLAYAHSSSNFGNHGFAGSIGWWPAWN